MLQLTRPETLLPREPRDVTGIVVHRIEVSQEDPTYADTPADVVRFFATHPIGQKATGGGMPYPILIDTAGQVTQVVPLGRITPHARSHNPQTVGVACLGDFRGIAPPAAQRAALVLVCATLLRQLGCTSDAVHGHDELAGGSADPDKECPGRHLPLALLRQDIAQAIAAEPVTWRFVW